MPKVTRVLPYLELSEIKEQLRKATDSDKRLRWQIIYTVEVDPRLGSVIAFQLGCSGCLVSNAVSEYNRLGKDSFKGSGRGSGRSNAHMSESEERKFLSKFINKASRGLICTISKIKIAYEKQIKQEVHDTVITRMLSRQGWRKLDPRPIHPKGSKQKQDSFKKTFPHWLPQQPKTKVLMIRDQQ